MNDFFPKLFSSDFMPHGHCYFWRPDILWLTVISNALIALSYYSIPIALMVFVRKRRDLEFQWIFVFFAIFIFACGTTHLMDIWTIWHGTYRLEGLMKLFTAVVSVITAILLWPLIPRALKIPSIASLKEEISERRNAENELKNIKQGLVAEIAKRTDELSQRLCERELMLKEIHHRVKNNMQVISSLLKLQSEYIKDKQAKNLFKQSDERVRSMALIHERLYRSETFADVEFGAYIKELTESLLRSYAVDLNNISLETNLQPVTLGIDQAIPCGLLLNEFISNALKHAFTSEVKRKGKIKILLSEKNDEVTLIVSDSGRGLPDDFTLEKPETLGFEIIKTLSEQLEAHLEVNSKSGTQFSIKFLRKLSPVNRSTDHGNSQYTYL